MKAEGGRLKAEGGLADVMALEAMAPAGEAPESFRVFAYGPGQITRFEGGKVVRLPYTFRPEHTERILANAQERGVRIPMDCEHMSHKLAKLCGISESSLTAIPLIGEKLKAGDVTLRAGDDGLYADVDWTPRGAELVKSKGYSYFSPVIQGAMTGDLMVSSMALTNVPALNDLDELAACAVANETGRSEMDKELQAAFAAMLGCDVIALSADDGAGELLGRLKTMNDEREAGKAAVAAQTAFLDSVRDGLALSADADLNMAQGKVLALLEGKGSDEQALSALRGRLELLEGNQEAGKKQGLIDKGLADGKLTPALVESWAGKQDSVALTAFLDSAPVVVPVGERKPADKPERDDDTLALSANLETIARNCGVDPKSLKKAG